MKKIKEILQKTKHIISYTIFSVLYFILPKKKYKIISDKKTVDKIVYEGVSIARFGDGEFKWIIGMKQKNFQKDNKEMDKRLKEVLKSNDKNVLIGIPGLLNDMSNIEFDPKRYWKKFLVRSYPKIKKYLDTNRVYCDSYITRPYMDKKDKKNTWKRYENLKRIWNDRDILIVEGEYSRLGVNNNLFDNAKSIKRLLCPSKNAFEKYNEIIDNTIKYGKEKLIILSLGPTATIMAYDLAKKGYQAIDLGHIDIEYMWFINNSKKKERVYGKIVNEVDGDEIIPDSNDEKYKKQIIMKI